MTTLDTLSARERQVFDLIAEGVPPQQIADRLGLSVKTVSTYRARVLEKLGVKSNAQIARLQSAEALAVAADHTLIAAALVSGVARWCPATQTGGEVAVNGLRYWCELDAHGVPTLHEILRRAIGVEMGLHATKVAA